MKVAKATKGLEEVGIEEKGGGEIPLCFYLVCSSLVLDYK
jgi:hypothetical protein